MATKIIYLQDPGALSIDSQRDYKNTSPFPVFVDFKNNTQVKSKLIFNTDRVISHGSVLLYEPDFFPLNQSTGDSNAGQLKVTGYSYYGTKWIEDLNTSWRDSFLITTDQLSLELPPQEQSKLVVEYVIDKTANLSTDITPKRLRISYVPVTRVAPLDSYYMAGANGDESMQDYFKTRYLDETNGVLTPSRLYNTPENVKLDFLVYEKAKCVLNIGYFDNISNNSPFKWHSSEIVVMRAYTGSGNSNDSNLGNISFEEEASIPGEYVVKPCYNTIEKLESLGSTTSNFIVGNGSLGWSSVIPSKNYQLWGHFTTEGVYRIKASIKGNGDKYNGVDGYNQDIVTKTIIVLPNTVSTGGTNTDPRNNLWKVTFDISGTLKITPKMSITQDPNNIIDYNNSNYTLSTIGSTSISCYPDLDYTSATLLISYSDSVSKTLTSLNLQDIDSRWVAYLEALYTVTCSLINSQTQEVIDTRTGFGNLVYNTNGSISNKSVGHTFYNIQPNSIPYQIIYTLTKKTIS